MNRIINKIISLLFWIHPALRFSFRISIESFRDFVIEKSSRVRCAISIRNGGRIWIGKEVEFAKTCSVAVSGENSLIEIRDGVKFGDFCRLSTANGHILKVAERTTFYSHATLSGHIEIGRDCLFGPNVTMLSGTHSIEGRDLIRSMDRKFFEINGTVNSKKIEIGDDCWLGVNSVILPGVRLGKGCVVGANSVVTKSFTDYSIIGGVPAKFIKFRPE